jgi:hypothetical protein
LQLEEIEVAVAGLVGDEFFVDAQGEGVDTAFRDERCTGSRGVGVRQLQDGLLTGTQEEGREEQDYAVYL